MLPPEVAICTAVHRQVRGRAAAYRLDQRPRVRGRRAAVAAGAAGRASDSLRSRAKRAGVPVIYCNDNFGKWRSDFRLLEHVLNDAVRGRPIAELLAPDAEDYFVLKPKHSGFNSTTLDVLLDHLGASTLILTGIAGNFCVLFTAQDAYMCDLRLVVPATASLPTRRRITATRSSTWRRSARPIPDARPGST